MTLTNSHSSRFNDLQPIRLVRATACHVFDASSLRRMRFAIAALIAFSMASSGAAQQADVPHFSTVSQAVQQYFASVEGYRPGDLITQSQVKNALEDVFEVGWEIPDSKTIVKLALADDSFLIKEMSSPRGKQFMRKLAENPGTFSRLDRLSTIAQGHDVVRQLISAKDGDLMIEYMATTKGGENLGRMMASAQRGVDLNKPTGRIYTAEDLLVLLERAYKKVNP